MADYIILSVLLALTVSALRAWKRTGTCSGCRACPHASKCPSNKEENQ